MYLASEKQRQNQCSQDLRLVPPSMISTDHNQVSQNQPNSHSVLLPRQCKGKEVLL